MDAKNLKILLIEDDEEDYLITRDLLAQIVGTSYLLHWVSNPQEGLQELLKCDYDVALLDYHLGATTGVAMVNSIDPTLLKSPIILLTGQGNLDIDKEAMLAGVLDYLNKNDLSASVLERSIRYSIQRKNTEINLFQAARRSELMADIAKDFVDSGPNIQNLLTGLARRIGDAYDDACIIRLLASDNLTLEAAAIYHPDPPTRKLLEQSTPTLIRTSDDGLVGRAARDQKTYRVHSNSLADIKTQLHAEYGSWLDQYNPGSIIVVPMIVQDRLKGTIALIRAVQSSPHSLEDEIYFGELAGRAALAIENVYLYQKEIDQAARMKALNIAISTLLQTLNLDELIIKILYAGRQALPKAKKMALYLYEANSERLNQFYLEGDSRVRLVRTKANDPDDFIYKTVRDQHSLFFRGDTSSTEFTIYLDFPDKVNSYSILFSPLMTDDDYFGALILETDQITELTEEDFEVFDTFTATVTGALHNARMHENVTRLAITDNLTGLLNRRGLFEFGQREIDRLHRLHRPLAIIMIDIDYFKDINDAHGHLFGDQVLKDLASSCIGNVRKIDLAGRYGGDEFIILLPETEIKRAEQIAERIRVCFSNKEYETKTGPFHVTASFGISYARDEKAELPDLINQADKALYGSKQSGRNQIGTL